jgi:predicted acetyltransferase
MEEMYDEGYVFSFLYPFSYSYYRKFGYEFNMSIVQCTLPFSALSHFRQTGKVELLLSYTDPSCIKSVYEQYIQGKNLALDWQSHWSRFHKNDPYSSNVYLYVWYDGEDNAKGYLQYTIDRSDMNSVKPDMRLREIVWLNGDAFRGMMAFLNGFASQFRNLIFVIPEHEDISLYFSEQGDIQQQIRIHGCNRVVHVKKALELMKTPAGRGKAVIEVRDDFFPKNTDRYLIEWENGEKMVIAGRKEEADLICSVHHLSQLITGYRSITQLQTAGCVEVRCEPGLLDSLFPRKALYILDMF